MMVFRKTEKEKARADLLDQQWEMRFLELKKFKREYGHCDVPLIKRLRRYGSLARWCVAQRHHRKFNRLKYSPDRVRKLDGIGFCWSIRDKQFESRLLELKQYFKKHGDYNVSFSQKGKSHVSLASWVLAVRTFYRTKDKRLSAKRISQLNSIGFNWINPLKVGLGNLIKDEDLITELKRLHLLQGKIPGIRYIDAHGKYSANTYIIHFGSMAKARKAAGLSAVIPYPKKCTDEEILLELKHLAVKLRRTPSSCDIDTYSKHSAALYRSRFGSIYNARKAAGIDARLIHHRRSSDAALLEDLRRVSILAGRPPTNSDLKKYGNYVVSTYQQHFGGLEKARAMAGLKPDIIRTPRKYSDEEVLEDIRRMAMLLGKEPSEIDARKHGRFAHTIYERRFGSFAKARQLAGLSPRIQKAKNFSDEQLIEDLRRVAVLVRKKPIGTDILKHGKYSLDTYYAHFGSIIKAREKAGLENIPAPPR